MVLAAYAALAIACVSCVVFLRNLFLYGEPPSVTESDLPPVSVLIPARNEQGSIGAAVQSVLSNRNIRFEVIVLDDSSTDATASIVAAIAQRDPRVRLAPGAPLPRGWCGKQHACFALAELARDPILCFMDADVRLAPDALVRSVAFLQRSGADLVSGFPRQVTQSLLERLMIPLIHFVLLGFLPMDGLRRSGHPAFAAGCGQLMLVRSEAYRRAGGHAAIRNSLHDGLNLPKAFRRAGCKSDLFDATGLATCRMYASAGEVWNGLLKNAIEGLAAPGRILPFTALLLIGQVMPLILASIALLGWTSPDVLLVSSCAVLASYLPRLLAVWRFKQPFGSALLHPLGTLLLLVIQWQAYLRARMRKSSNWKGRAYAPVSPVEKSGAAESAQTTA